MFRFGVADLWTFVDVLLRGRKKVNSRTVKARFANSVLSKNEKCLHSFMLAGAEALLGGGGFLGGLGADGDAGVRLVGLGDARFGDRDAQGGGGGDAAVVGGAQSGRGGLGGGSEALGDGGGVGGGGFGVLHGLVLSSLRMLK